MGRGDGRVRRRRRARGAAGVRARPADDARISVAGVLQAIALVLVIGVVAFAAAGVVFGPGEISLGGGPGDGDGPPAEPTATPDAASDSDGDGLPDDREAELGTDPDAYDTDQDRLRDGREVALGTDPTAADTDDDGIVDGREVDLGTDPTVADTDGDGLADGREADLRTDPTAPDTDGDGLRDARELELGTDPTAADTDGDELPDRAELESDLLPGADPLQYDVYVEIDYLGDLRLSAGDRRAIREAFASAPIDNPGGERGIDLHLVRDERLPGGGVVDLEDVTRYADDHRDYSCAGYHYAILAPGTTIIDAPNRDVTRGAGGVGRGIFVSNGDGFVFMHEFGHSLGLGHGPEGASYQEYPSMMNYAVPRETREFYGYTEGDWEQIASTDRAVKVDAFGDPAVDPGDEC